HLPSAQLTRRNPSSQVVIAQDLERNHCLKLKHRPTHAPLHTSHVYPCGFPVLVVRADALWLLAANARPLVREGGCKNSLSSTHRGAHTTAAGDITSAALPSQHPPRWTSTDDTAPDFTPYSTIYLGLDTGVGHVQSYVVKLLDIHAHAEPLSEEACIEDVLQALLNAEHSEAGDALRLCGERPHIYYYVGTSRRPVEIEFGERAIRDGTHYKELGRLDHLLRSQAPFPLRNRRWQVDAHELYTVYVVGIPEHGADLLAPVLVPLAPIDPALLAPLHAVLEGTTFQQHLTVGRVMLVAASLGLDCSSWQLSSSVSVENGLALTLGILLRWMHDNCGVPRPNHLKNTLLLYQKTVAARASLIAGGTRSAMQQQDLDVCDCLLASALPPFPPPTAADVRAVTINLVGLAQLHERCGA
ncbi:hypothetical protein C8R44DRAFT_893640, partial [Mycena epipterygia]